MSREMVTIYVLHEYGDPNHYEGLKYYCDENNYKLKFYEFSLFENLKKGIRAGDFEKVCKLVPNLIFLFRLLFTKNKNVVLGIAPYDYRMLVFNKLARRHKIFYHTSWPHWDGSQFPKKRFYSKLRQIIDASWKAFFERNVQGIFCVSKYTEIQLLEHFSILAPIQVVYHSIDEGTFFSNKMDKEKIFKFLYVGRILEKKGLREIFTLFKKLPRSFVFGVAGNGELAPEVERFAADNDHFQFLGHISRSELGSLYRDYDVLLLPSKKGYGDWEELFGMTIIEGMACGCIPVATDHIGPKEIIRHGFNGFLLRDENMETDLLDIIENLIGVSNHEFTKLKNNAISSASCYHSSNIAKRWAKIFDSVKFI